MSWNLWLDDVRDPTPTHQDSVLSGLEWKVARSTAEALTLVRNHGWPLRMSLDHDLGGDDTVMVFLKTLALEWDGTSQLPKFKVHSANPVGRDNIISFMKSWQRIADRERERGMTEIYISVDIETDGDCPGLNSMLSLGAASLYPMTSVSVEGTRLSPLNDHDTFYKTFKRLPEAKPSNATMEWWDQFPKQWEETRREPVDPAKGIQDFENWVTSVLRDMKDTGVQDPKPIFLAGPIGFDFTFVYYYMHRFLGRCIFGHNGVDMRSVAMGVLDQPYLTKKERHPDEWATKRPHTHNALEDAMEQAERFRKMMMWRKKMELRVKGTP